ncbi:unnamed protein product [Protopolystoma xenopodis]|uniref:Uncharacterized protein n=1 Tax=Protopolystoma xenopodis TaxID=117903 RepID=A0A448WQP7_9PLAT|nr:unnamed protein product [Protopolystoma xenopodis]
MLSRFCGFVCFGIPLTGLKGPLRGSPSDPLVAWWRSTSSSRVWSGAGLLVVGERSRLGGYQAASLFRRHLQPPRVQSSASPGGLGTNAALVGREAKASGLDSEAGAMNGAASGAISSLPPTPSLIGQRSTPSLVGQSIIDEVVSSRIQRQLKSGENRVTESDDAEFADNEDNDNEEKVGTEIGLTRPRDIFSLSRRIPDRRSNMCSSSVSDKPRQQTPVSEMSSSITGPTRTVSGRLDILVVGGADHLLRMHSSSCQRW